NAIIGELMMTRAKQRGVAGIVIWGAIRDSAEIGGGTYPVFAAGVTHRGPYKNGPGEINVPIMMGGTPVNPGDIIVGDADGLVAVPQELALQVLASAKAILAKETAAKEQILAGTVDRGWVGKAVRRGVKRALVSCDLPPQQGTEAAVRLVKEGGADMVKLNGTAEAVRAVVRAGLPVFAEFHGGGAVAELVVQAKRLEEAGASLLDFRH